MSGSIYGTIFKVTTWGESHGKAVGAVIDGCPAGLLLCEDDFKNDMSRRRPGSGKLSTKRNEDDAVEILSGVFDGKTTGTPISLIIYNKDQHSADYSEIAKLYRPGHADYCFDKKYGFRDYRGGGRSSGRETAARVAAGVVAKKILTSVGVKIKSRAEIPKLPEILDESDSYGGTIECVVSGLCAGVGEPVFDKLDAKLAQAVMSIGAVKAVSFGAGFSVAEMKGSENNDIFYTKNGEIKKANNNSGGILGGISDGSDIIIKCAVKPTPSISKPQKTVDSDGNSREIEIKGRHDISIVPRAAVVVEAMTAITVVDGLLVKMTNRIENLKN